MAIPITIPRLGWSMDEGLFGEWVRQTGDQITAGDPLFLLETEKALQEVESVDSGILHIVGDGPTQGDTVRVGTVVAWLLAEDESPPEVTPDAPPETPNAAASPATTPARASVAQPEPVPVADKAQCVASPSVRRLARQLNVNLNSAGFTGTISEHDVRRAADGVQPTQIVLPDAGSGIVGRNSHPSLPTISPRAARTARRLSVNWTQLTPSGTSGRISEKDVLAAAGLNSLPEGTWETASTVRARTAERMAESVRSTVPVTLNSTAIVDGLLEDRSRRRETAAQQIPSVHDYIIHAVAIALTEYRDLNSCWMNGEILRPDHVHVGLAVDTERGLIVPVVRNADRLSLEQIAEETSRLIEGSRAGRLLSRDVSEGTFTVTSLGSLGIDEFTPVINPGEGAILGVGAIRMVARPGMEEGSVEWRQQMTLSLTFDHQVTDGAPAARFLKHIATSLAQL